MKTLFKRLAWLAVLFWTASSLPATELQVMQRAPEGELESLEAAKEVVVTFNFPMVALGSGEDSGAFCPIKIEPSLAGRCRWRGTNTLVFEFKKVPGPGQKVKISIPVGTASKVGGQKLPEEVSFEFQTKRPELGKIIPEARSHWLGLKPVFYAQFSLSMSAERALDYVHLMEEEDEVPLGLKVYQFKDLRKAHAKGEMTDVDFYRWGGADQVLEFRPKRDLKQDKEYNLEFRSGWPAIGGTPGEGGLPQTLKLKYYTYGSFKALGLGSDEKCSATPYLMLSNPIAVENLPRLVEISPEAELRKASGDERPVEAYQSQGGAWRLPLRAWKFKPGQDYRFEFSGEIKDAFGQSLESSQAYSWTAPGLCPDLEFSGGFGVLESYAPARHPLQAVNQESLPMKVKALKPEEAIVAYQQHRYWGGGNPLEGGKSLDWPASVSPNVRSHAPIDLYKLLGSDLSAFTLLSVKLGDKNWSTALDNRTALGLTMKSSPEGVLIWVTSLRDGKPVPGIPLELRDSSNTVRWQGSSDKDGLAKAPGWKALGIPKWKRYESPELFLLARSPEGSALLSSHYRDGIEPWRFNLSYGGYDESPSLLQRRFFTFTERGIYRPGEKVHLKGLVRDLEDGDWLEGTKLKLIRMEVQDSRDKLLLTATAKVDLNGGFGLDFSIPKDAATGYWNIRKARPKKGKAREVVEETEEGGVEVETDEDGDSEATSGYFSQGFRVEAVKAATYEMSLSGIKPWLRLGESLEVELQGRYLAGAGMPGAQGQWTLNLSPTGFRPQGWDGFNFWAPNESDQVPEDEESEETSQPQVSRLAGSGAFVLDASSRFHVSAGTKAGRGCAPCVANLEVGLTSPDRQKLFARGSAMVHGSLAYPGIKLARDFASVGEPYSVQWVVVDPEGRTQSGRKTSLRLIREVRQSVRKVGAFGRLEWMSEERLEQAGTWEESSGNAPKNWSFTPKQPGRYRFFVKSKDSDGNTQEAGAYFYAYGPGEASWTRDDSQMIELVPDKDEYQPGDKAKILIKSPWKEAMALITVEREGVMASWVKKVGTADAVEIPIAKDYLPNAYVSVVLSRGRAKEKSFGPDGEDLAKPQARFGALSLKVTPKDRKLSVEPSTDRPEYRPGAKVEASVKVLGNDGSPAKADITLFAVDEGILKLTNYGTPNPFQEFYGPRPLWVTAADNRLAVIGMRGSGEKGEDRGGGGMLMEANDRMAGIDLRTRFETVAFWSASLKSGKDGLVKASFQLPDNLTRFRLMAVASSGRRFGSGETGLKVSKALALRPSLPRFARLGDKMEAGVTLQNTSSFEGKIAVEILAPENLKLEGKKLQEVSLKPGEARELRWSLEALALGEAVLRFAARGKLGGSEETDGLEWKLPVEMPEKAEHAATSGAVDAAPAVEALAKPSNASQGRTALKVEFSSTAMLGLRGGMEYLLGYPHGCLEQRLSKVLPLMAGKELLEAFKLGPMPEKVKAAQETLDMLPQFQAGSGGYRYWTDSWLKADPWLTAYTLEVAALAKEAGLKLPQDSISKAVDWLRNHYDDNRSWAYGYSEEEKDVLRAWALYSLSRHGVKLSGLYSELMGRRKKLPLFSKADLLRVAPQLGEPGQVKLLAQELLNQANVNPRTLHFEEPHPERMPWVHASTVAVTGFCVDALLSAQGGFEGDAKAALWLSQARRKDGAWDNTQSNAWALMGLSRYFKRYEKEIPDFKASLKLNGKAAFNERLAGRSLAPKIKEFLEAELFDGSKEAKLEVAKDGRGRLYYSLGLSWVPARLDKPVFEGFEIERSLSGLKGGKAGTSLKAGERYLMTLKVKTRQDRTFVALSDFLPAGLEVVDSSLATESQAGMPETGASSTTDDPWGGWWGRFQRHENYDDRVQVYADFLAAGEHTWKYVVQATTPGLFSQPAAWVEMMYEPEVYGRTAGQEIEVKP